MEHNDNPHLKQSGTTDDASTETDAYPGDDRRERTARGASAPDRASDRDAAGPDRTPDQASVLVAAGVDEACSPIARARQAIEDLRHVDEHTRREVLQVLLGAAEERGVEWTDADPLTDDVFRARDHFDQATETAVADGSGVEVDADFVDGLHELGVELESLASRIESIATDYQHGRLTRAEARRKAAAELDAGVDSRDVLQEGQGGS